MLVAVISDIHDNLVNLEKCLYWCKNHNIGIIICCGDVSNSDTVKYLGENFSGKIHLVQGNMEIFSEAELEKHENIIYYGKAGRFKAGGKTVGVCHEPFRIKDVLSRGSCDIIFYGHTHKPWSSFASTYAKASADKKATEDKDKDKNRIKLVNPGTLGGMFQKATFAVWDTESGNIELKILDTL